MALSKLTAKNSDASISNGKTKKSKKKSTNSLLTIIKQRMMDINRRSVFVQHLHPVHTSGRLLSQWCPSVLSCRMPYRFGQKRKIKGFAFLEFKTPQIALRQIGKLNGKLVSRGGGEEEEPTGNDDATVRRPIEAELCDNATTRTKIAAFQLADFNMERLVVTGFPANSRISLVKHTFDKNWPNVAARMQFRTHPDGTLSMATLSEFETINSNTTTTKAMNGDGDNEKLEGRPDHIRGEMSCADWAKRIFREAAKWNLFEKPLLVNFELVRASKYEKQEMLRERREDRAQKSPRTEITEETQAEEEQKVCSEQTEQSATAKKKQRKRKLSEDSEQSAQKVSRQTTMKEPKLKSTTLTNQRDSKKVKKAKTKKHEKNA